MEFNARFIEETFTLIETQNQPTTFNIKSEP